MGNSLKTTENMPRRRRMLLPALVCVVSILGGFVLIWSVLYDGSHAYECTISRIISEPAYWEDRIVMVEGVAEEIPLGIVQPFNY
jgi:ABC-type uncharacterized transport system permease subunit